MVYGCSFLRNGAALLTAASLLFTSLLAARADEKGGLLVDIQKKIAEQKDAPPSPSQGPYRPVNRTLSLNVSVKNVSMKPMASATADFTVLIQRWGVDPHSEGAVIRYEGSKPLDALPTAHSLAVDLGQFHLGGFQYYTSASEQFVDRMVGWKVTITRDGQKLDFKSGSSFDTLAKRSKSAH